MWRETLDVNLTGVWRTLQAALPLVIEGGRGGSIVLVSSTAGVAGYASMPHYVAAKHGVVGLMRALANEVGKHAIRVNALLAGMVNTPMGVTPAPSGRSGPTCRTRPGTTPTRPCVPPT